MGVSAVMAGSKAAALVWPAVKVMLLLLFATLSAGDRTALTGGKALKGRVTGLLPPVMKGAAREKTEF